MREKYLIDNLPVVKKIRMLGVNCEVYDYRKDSELYVVSVPIMGGFVLTGPFHKDVIEDEEYLERDILTQINVDLGRACAAMLMYLK